MQENFFWSFDIVHYIDEYNTIIRNRFNNQLMVRKISSAECYPVLCMIKNIHHKNLMGIYDVILENDICISICEFINGYTLDYLVENNGVFKEKKAKQIMTDVCNGLTALHKNGIIHKDIKPSNIILSDDNTAKIIDFDISRTQKPGKTKDTSTFGTVGYASPEHFGFSQSDEKTDIYSCGVLLNYLLTGREPQEYLYPGTLRYIIQDCTEIDKEKRYRNAEELKLVLKGKIKPKKRDYIPLPGFRGRHILPKILMSVLLFIYFLMFYIYIRFMITGDSTLRSYTLSEQFLNLFIFFFCFTAFPYIFFGDVGKLSEKLNPRNPKKGKSFLTFFGVLSIILGFILLFAQIK